MLSLSVSFSLHFNRFPVHNLYHFRLFFLIARNAGNIWLNCFHVLSYFVSIIWQHRRELTWFFSPDLPFFDGNLHDDILTIFSRFFRCVYRMWVCVSKSFVSRAFWGVAPGYLPSYLWAKNQNQCIYRKQLNVWTQNDWIESLCICTYLLYSLIDLILW